MMGWRGVAWAAVVAVVGGACASYPPDVTVAPGPVVAPPQAAPVVEAQAADVVFQKLATDFLEGVLELRPVKATELGDHRFDGRWPVLGAEGEKAELQFIAAMRAALDGIDRNGLNVHNRVDGSIMAVRLSRWQFEIEQLRRWENNPLSYTRLIGDGLDPLLSREFAPLDQRLESLRERLSGVAAVVQAAKATLKRPPKVHTQTAIEQNDGLIAFVDGHLREVVRTVPAKKDAIGKAADGAVAALRDFGAFLKEDLLPRSDGDFRLGKERFDRKLGYTLDAEIRSEELLAGARAMLEQTQAQMVDTSVELWPELFGKRRLPRHGTARQKARLVRQVLSRLADDRPTNATIVAEARKLVEQATEFVRDHNLVEVPNEPVEVIEMPEFRRGVAIAYCDSAGPLEKQRHTFYAISPTPKSWSRKRALSFYREYNRAMLAELTIHEAMPGHALQLGLSARFRSPIRAVFDSGTFIEGWAVYSEWLMAKHGFGGPRVRLQRQKMALRVAANAVLDAGVHAGSMSKAEAIKLMTEQAFQEEGEAEGKWKRAKLTSAQLSTYYYGFSEVMKLRQRAEKQSGFRERAFHDQLLSFGSPPPRYLAHLLFGDPL